MGERSACTATRFVLSPSARRFISPAPASADLDASGDIGLGDIAAIIAAWGSACPQQHFELER
jgi:hypothetical protein